MALEIPYNRFYPNAYVRVTTITLHYDRAMAEAGLAIYGDETSRAQGETSIGAFGITLPWPPWAITTHGPVFTPT